MALAGIARLVETIWQDLSGERAWRDTARLAMVRRPVGTAGARACLAMCEEALRAAGLGQVERLSFPVDGAARYGPAGPAGVWEPRAARLTLVAPEERLLCDFAREPMVLAALSRSTPPGGVTAELVDVGPGDRPEHYAGKEVAGRIALADGSAREAARLAIETHGAAGVLLAGLYRESSDPTVRRSRYDLPDAIVSAALNPQDPANPRGFGFSLSYRQVEELRALLRQGSVRLRAEVEADFGPGQMELTTTVLPGTDLAAQEVWVIAHLIEGHALMVGANDNCSGAACAVEILRTLAAAIAAGRLARPRRSLRLLLVPEISGTAAYLAADPVRAERCTAGINLDMVGADHAVTHAITNLVCTPWSVPSFLNDAGEHILGLVANRGRLHQGEIAIPNFAYAATPFASASDHAVLVDGAYAIPCVFFFEWPDRFYHTQLDTPDKVSPVTLHRNGTAAAALAYAVAAADGELVREMLTLADSGARRRMAAAVSQGVAAVVAADAEARPALAGEWAERVTVMGEVGQRALASAVALLPAAEGEALRPQGAPRQAALARAAAAERERLLDAVGVAPPVAAAAPEAALRPRRLYGGVFPRREVTERIPDWAERERAAGRADPRHGQKTFELLNLCDGAHTLGEICRLVTAEFGPFAVGDAVAYLAPLVEHGWVAW
jgi:hypothetical protein